MTQGNKTVELLPVTQADRDAAASHLRPADRYNGMADLIELGGADDDSLVQDFARHRLSHTPEPATELVEALTKCVAVIERFKDATLLAEGVHTGLRKGTEARDSHALWTAIANSRTTAWQDAISFALDPYFTMWGGNDALKAAQAALATLSQDQQS